MKKPFKILMIALSLAGSVSIATPAHAKLSICDMEASSYSMWLYQKFAC